MALYQDLPVYRDMPGTWRCRTGLAGCRDEAVTYLGVGLQRSSA